MLKEANVEPDDSVIRVSRPNPLRLKSQKGSAKSTPDGVGMDAKASDATDAGSSALGCRCKMKSLGDDDGSTRARLSITSCRADGILVNNVRALYIDVR
jgi:hypothetical protein